MRFTYITARSDAESPTSTESSKLSRSELAVTSLEPVGGSPHSRRKADVHHRSIASSAASEPADSAEQFRSDAVAADGGRAVWAGRTSSGIEQVAHHDDLRLRDATQGFAITMHRSVEHLTTHDRRSDTTTYACRLDRLEVLLLLTHLSRRDRAQLIMASSRRNHNLAAAHTNRLSASAKPVRLRDGQRWVRDARVVRIARPA